MRDCTILHDILENHCSSIHKKRLASLMVATQSLLDGQQLSLTELGRNIRGKVSAKHNIKRIDRLLGNASLYRERVTIYRWELNSYVSRCHALSFWLIGLMSESKPAT